MAHSTAVILYLTAAVPASGGILWNYYRTCLRSAPATVRQAGQ